MIKAMYKILIVSILCTIKYVNIKNKKSFFDFYWSDHYSRYVIDCNDHPVKVKISRIL